MIDMLSLRFWAWVIGTVVGGVITVLALIYGIGVLFGMNQKEKKDESPLDRWKRGG